MERGPTGMGMQTRPRGFRVRIRKTGAARFLSHKNLLLAFERALRRAGLPLAFTEGFHPHPRIRLRPALAVGASALDAALDVALAEERDPGDLLALLAAQMPDGLEVASAAALPDIKPSPLVAVHWRFGPGRGCSLPPPRPGALLPPGAVLHHEPDGACSLVLAVEGGQDPPGARALALALFPAEAVERALLAAELTRTEFRDGL